MKKYVGSCLLFFIPFFKTLINLFYHPKGCTSYVPQLCLQVKNQLLLLALGGWLEEKNTSNKIGK